MEILISSVVIVIYVDRDRMMKLYTSNMYNLAYFNHISIKLEGKKSTQGPGIKYSEDSPMSTSALQFPYLLTQLLILDRKEMEGCGKTPK